MKGVPSASRTQQQEDLTDNPNNSRPESTRAGNAPPRVKESQQTLFPAKSERELRKLGVGDALVCLQHEALDQPPQRVRNRRPSGNVALQALANRCD